jgi:7-cyano-7-deazaguanine synthase
LRAFETLANLATKAGVEGARYTVHAPLLQWTKADIIKAGLALGVNYGATVSCYRADSEGRACGRCDSCTFRKKGFQEAGVIDPTRYF